jgi:hypothetical protein
MGWVIWCTSVPSAAAIGIAVEKGCEGRQEAETRGRPSAQVTGG